MKLLSTPSSQLLRNIAAMIISGALWGISYPPNPFGYFAFIAFVPFLFVITHQESYATALRYSYVMLFTVNVITLYWIGGFTHGRDTYLMTAGIAVLLAHPLFYFIPIVAFLFVKNNISKLVAIISFPFLWVAFEYFRAHTDFAFPWMLIGNTQTYNLSYIQIASFTGVYGISFLVLCVNVICVILFQNLLNKRWHFFSTQSSICGICILIFFLAPKIIGKIILEEQTISEEKNTVRVAIIQPNIDPWEKWQNTIDYQMNILYQMSSEAAIFQPDLVVYPETAIPMYILQPQNELYFASFKTFIDTMQLNIMTGIPDVEFYEDSSTAPNDTKIFSDSHIRYKIFNSSMLLQPNSDNIQKYAKMFLVPFAERVPYAGNLEWLKIFQWDIGIGGWGQGNDSTIFECIKKDGSRFFYSNMICYESIFPQLASNFANSNAEFFTIMTNDSWWGNTSGAYQHLRFAVFRAIENRRWIVRSANGGISCFIDPYGKIHQSTEYNSRAIISKEISLSHTKTFYAEHADWFALWCVFFSTLLISIAVTKQFFM
ncbi:MAG: apolipoprotein N-acyltransferase [Bacteroidota bacterium]